MTIDTEKKDEEGASTALRPRPVTTQDTQFFFDGSREHRLLIQRCTQCGVLRHPPMPACAKCGSLAWDTIESTRRGELLTYTVVHAPRVEPFVTPYVVGLAELEEGTRLVAEVVDVDPADVSIGLSVSVDFVAFDPELTLPVFRLDAGR